MMKLHVKKGENKTFSPDTLSEKVKEFLDMNYHKKITLKYISNIFYFNPYYISHVFKKSMGDSPYNYLIKKRMNITESLILSTDLSINNIAVIVGYGNSLYFTVAFKKYFGMSPSSFRINGGNET